MPNMNSRNLAMRAGYALAVRAERIDIDNWMDHFAGAPAHVVGHANAPPRIA